MVNLIFKNHPAEWHTGSDFPKVSLTQVSWDIAPNKPVAHVFFGHVNIDFDGSPTAYGPPEITPIPDDDLKNIFRTAMLIPLRFHTELCPESSSLWDSALVTTDWPCDMMTVCKADSISWMLGETTMRWENVPTK